MTWRNGGQGSQIPTRTKRIVNRRQHGLCNTINTTTCTGLIEQYDHIINVKSTNLPRDLLNDDPDFIQGLCTPCHKAKTKDEAHYARWGRRLRPAQPHPSEVI